MAPNLSCSHLLPSGLSINAGVSACARVVHGELLDEHGEFFIQRRSDGSGPRRAVAGGDPAAADAAEWHNGYEVPSGLMQWHAHLVPFIFGCVATLARAYAHVSAVFQRVTTRQDRAVLLSPYTLLMRVGLKVLAVRQVVLAALPPVVSLITAEAVLFVGKAQRILLHRPSDGKAYHVATAPSAAVQHFAKTLRELQRQPSLNQIRLEQAVTAVHAEVRSLHFRGLNVSIFLASHKMPPMLVKRIAAYGWLNLLRGRCMHRHSRYVTDTAPLEQ